MNNRLKVWLQHNLRYGHHYTVETIYREWVGYMQDCGTDEKFIMNRDSMVKRLAELGREESPCISLRKVKDGHLYLKVEIIDGVRFSKWHHKAMELLDWGKKFCKR